ncbi:MAG: hypothetical protein ABIS92_00215 [Polyangia bacterium]
MTPSQVSEVPWAAVPFEPPATTTWPAFDTAGGSKVAVCAHRKVFMVPAVGNVAVLPDAGMVKITEVPRAVVTFFPPASSTFPLASVVAV